MNRHLKISSPWSQLGVFMLLLAGCLIITSSINQEIGSAAGVVTERGELMDLNSPVKVAVAKLLQAMATIFIFGTPAILLGRLTYPSAPFSFLGLRRPEKYIFFVLATAILLFSFLPEGWFGQLNQTIRLPARMIQWEKDASKQMSVLLKVNSIWDILINLILIALLPAIFEELCFRGALQRILIQIFKSPWAGIIFTAILFSAFHMQFQGFLPRMFLGILLGAIYWYSGSLWVSILAHFLTNGIQVVAVSFYPKMIDENPSVPVTGALISLLIIVGLLMVMRRQSTVTYAGVYEEDPIQS
ncbi:lysostaphin resistance A-like protein [Flavitalea flava]